MPPTTPTLHENHQREQYFFARPTLERLSLLVEGYHHPVLLCCPMVGRHLWEEHKRAVTVLDVDERFSFLPGFVSWDLYHPTPLPFVPDLLVIDPPFHMVRLDQLFLAIRTLVHGQMGLPMLITSLPERVDALVGTLCASGLRP